MLVRWPRLLIVCCCGLLFCHGLRGPFYRTEGLRALVAAEMLRSGNWVVPTLYGEPLLTKPPGMYVAIALASFPFGEVREWTARLPSVVAATVMVLLFYRAFARALGRCGGLTAALILPASLVWLERVPSAEIDMLQTAWVSAALLCFLRALEASGGCEPPVCAASVGSHPPLAPATGGSHPPLAWWCAALLCVAGGLLTKWTAPAFFYLTVVPLLWWRGQLHLLVCRAHLLSVALAAGLCLTWAGAAVAAVGWDVCRETVMREALTKLWPGQRPGAYPWRETLLFPVRVLAVNLPWSVAALFTLRPGFAALWSEDGRRLLQLLHCWTWPNLLFWSLVPTHAVRHSLPLVPGLAGLAALVWIAWLDGRLRWPLPVCPPRATLASLLVLWLAVKLAFVYVVLPERDRQRQPRAKGERFAALVPPGRSLYLFRAKDEGILFYFGRPARRLPRPSHLPPTGEPLYCILTGAEWRQWCGPGSVEAIERIADEQGAPLLLVRVHRAHRLRRVRGTGGEARADE